MCHLNILSPYHDLFGKIKKWSTVTCYSVNKPYTHVQWRNSATRDYTFIRTHLHEMSRIGKLTEKKKWISGCPGMAQVEREREWLLRLCIVSFFAMMRMFKNWLWWWLPNSVNILKTSELCTLNGWILRYVNYISIKRFKKYYYNPRKTPSANQEGFSPFILKGIWEMSKPQGRAFSLVIEMLATTSAFCIGVTGFHTWLWLLIPATSWCRPWEAVVLAGFGTWILTLEFPAPSFSLVQSLLLPALGQWTGGCELSLYVSLPLN